MSAATAARATPALNGELFLDLDPDELRRLAAVAETVKIPSGTRIFNLGEEATSLLFISEGTVGLTLPIVVHGAGHEVTLDEKTTGSVIAWSALVAPHRLTMGAVAKSDVTLVRFERGALDKLFAAERELHRKVIVNLSRVIAGRVAILEALVIRDLQRQVAER